MMEKQQNHRLALLIVCTIAVLPFISCEKDPLVIDGDLGQIQNTIDSAHARQFDSTVCGGTLVRPSDPPHMDGPQLLSAPVTSLQDGILCTISSYRWQIGDQSAFLYDPTSDVFFVTAVLDGTSIAPGIYRPIVVPVSPKVLSVSLENVGGSPKITIDNPTLANVRAGVVELLRQLTPTSTPARLSYTIEEMKASEQTSIAVRANYGGFGAKVNASFDWSSSESKSRFLVNFLQIYYTLDMDITHASPSQYFTQGSLPNMADFNGGMPVYVSSIKYGRQIVLAVESSSNAEDVNAALQASFSGFGLTGGIDISNQQKQTLENSKISAFVVGGSGAVATQNITNVDGLEAILRNGGEYSAQSPGAPLAYTLRYLCDNSIAKVALASEYTVRQCEEVGIEYNFTPTNNGGTGYYYCAIHVPGMGDGEFGGNGPLVTGKITLSAEAGGTEIWCDLDVKWVEQGADNSKGEVKKKFHLHTLPLGKQFLGFTTSNIARFEHLDLSGSAPDFPSVTGGDFVSSVRFIGDTAGPDLGCDGDADANIRLWLKTIKIRVKNI